MERSEIGALQRRDDMSRIALQLEVLMAASHSLPRNDGWIWIRDLAAHCARGLYLRLSP